MTISPDSHLLQFKMRDIDPSLLQVLGCTPVVGRVIACLRRQQKNWDVLEVDKLSWGWILRLDRARDRGFGWGCDGLLDQIDLRQDYRRIVRDRNVGQTVRTGGFVTEEGFVEWRTGRFQVDDGFRKFWASIGNEPGHETAL